MNQSVEWYLGMNLDDLEKMVILKAMGLLHKDVKAVARALGRSHRTIETKLEQYENEEQAILERERERLKRRQDFLDRSRATPPQFFRETYPDTAPVYSEEGKLLTGDAFKSPPTTATEPEMPVSERSEVQEVLSEQTTVLREKRRR